MNNQLSMHLSKCPAVTRQAVGTAECSTHSVRVVLITPTVHVHWLASPVSAGGDGGQRTCHLLHTTWRHMITAASYIICGGMCLRVGICGVILATLCHLAGGLLCPGAVHCTPVNKTLRT
jgi:hypothetical protein